MKLSKMSSDHAASLRTLAQAFVTRILAHPDVSYRRRAPLGGGK